MKKTILMLAFATMLCAQTSIHAADIIAAPNPWIPEGGKAQTGDSSSGIKFKNIPLECELLIYTLSGDLVMKAQIAGGSGIYKWDGKNEDNADAASGVYFWVVKSQEATKSGKLIIIR